MPIGTPLISTCCLGEPIRVLPPPMRTAAAIGAGEGRVVME
jgi:hypothetical protein